MTAKKKDGYKVFVGGSGVEGSCAESSKKVTTIIVPGGDLQCGPTTLPDGSLRWGIHAVEVLVRSGAENGRRTGSPTKRGSPEVRIFSDSKELGYTQGGHGKREEMQPRWTRRSEKGARGF